MALAPLSLRAYAAHRKSHGLPGGSLQAVQRAARAGRITVVDGRIPDPEAADREWAANTDHSRSPGYVKDWADEGEGDIDIEDGGADPNAPSMARESALLKREQRIAAQLKNLKDAGELVLAADVAAEVAEAFTLVRNRITGLPSKAKQQLPHLTLDDVATLEDIVEEALQALVREGSAAAP
jgi:phage terminase Nu1 subunit (DNA packaging protein)